MTSNQQQQQNNQTNLNQRQDQHADLPSVQNYVIWMRNDEYTPFRLVQNMLTSVFHMNAQAAVSIAHACHEQGQAVIYGPTSRDLVETRLTQAQQWLSAHEFYGRNGSQLVLHMEEA